MPASEPDLLLDPESANEADGRRHVRYVSFQGNVLKLAVRPAFGGRAAMLIDVSAGGVGFLLDIPLKVGDVLALNLNSADASGSSVRLARVRHCRPHPLPPDAPWLPRPSALSRVASWFMSRPAATPSGEAWLIGCAFNRPLGKAELEMLIDNLRQLIGQNKRRAAP
jgi:hypothetical protein